MPLSLAVASSTTRASRIAARLAFAVVRHRCASLAAAAISAGTSGKHLTGITRGGLAATPCSSSLRASERVRRPEPDRDGDVECLAPVAAGAAHDSIANDLPRDRDRLVIGVMYAVAPQCQHLVPIMAIELTTCRLGHPQISAAGRAFSRSGGPAIGYLPHQHLGRFALPPTACSSRPARGRARAVVAPVPRVPVKRAYHPIGIGIGPPGCGPQGWPGP